MTPLFVWHVTGKSKVEWLLISWCILWRWLWGGDIFQTPGRIYVFIRICCFVRPYNCWPVTQTAGGRRWAMRKIYGPGAKLGKLTSCWILMSFIMFTLRCTFVVTMIWSVTSRCDKNTRRQGDQSSYNKLDFISCVFRITSRRAIFWL
jgi:hypothetical protein